MPETTLRYQGQESVVLGLGLEKDLKGHGLTVGYYRLPAQRSQIKDRRLHNIISSVKLEVTSLCWGETLKI